MFLHLKCQVRFQDPDEAVAQGAVEPGGGADREEDDHLGPLRHPWPVHLGTKVKPATKTLFC